MKKVVKQNFNSLKGTLTIPADKSMSHRAIIFPSLAKGKSIIRSFSTGQDPHSTLNIFKNLGVNIELIDDTTVEINSTGKLSAPNIDLDCGNSGTTMRLLTGVLASRDFKSTLVGDESLSKRPMKRVIEPLTQMGAQITSNNHKAPLNIVGQKLHSINFQSKIASAQVKSCILLAGLNTEGTTTVTEPFISRNHTEILLKHMGAKISTKGTIVSIEKSELQPVEINIFGDISSAAYFIVAGLIVPNSEIILKNVGLNPTRTGILEVVKKMGGNIEILDEHETCGELVGDIKVKYSPELKGCEISGEFIPKLIDEIPIIAVLATQAEGQTTISDAQDLRNKESDRITAVVTELKKLGADIEEKPDGMIICGKTDLLGDCEIETYHDHRLAMSLYVAGLICKKEIAINGFEWVNISFPEFEKMFEKLKIGTFN